MSAGTLTNLTAFGESFTAGFKRSFQSNPGAEICVFANATGGVIPPWDGNCSSGWRKRGNKHFDAGGAGFGPGAPFPRK